MPKLFLICPECGSRFEAKHHRAQFCSPAHTKAYNNRQLAEGQRIVAIAKAWRMGKDIYRNKSPESAGLRQAAKDAFSQLCSELDMLNAGDREAGRVPALKVYRRRQIAGLLDYQGPLARANSRDRPDCPDAAQ